MDILRNKEVEEELEVPSMAGYRGEDEVIRKNMALAQERTYAADFIEALPEDERAEVIDGQLFYMASPTVEHQDLIGFIYGNMWNHIRSRKGNCRVYFSPVSVYLDQNSRTLLEPDLILVCDQGKRRRGGFWGAPDMVAEVVSPSTQSRDYLLKLNKYQAAGVRVYWILNTAKDTIHVYDFEQEKMEIYSFRDRVPVRLLDGLEIDFGEFKPGDGEEPDEEVR